MCSLADGPTVVVVDHVGHAHLMQGTVEWVLQLPSGVCFPCWSSCGESEDGVSEDADNA